MFSRLLRFSLFFLLNFYCLFAQNNDVYNIDSLNEVYATKPKFGVLLGFNPVFHFTSFNQFSGIPCCSPKMNFGFGWGWNIGVLADYFLYDYLFLSPRVFFREGKANFNREEKTTVIVDGIAQDGKFEHQLKTLFRSFEFELNANYTTDFFFWYFGGLGLSYVSKAWFHQKEVITEPADRGTFNNGLRTRNEYSGDIPEVRTLTPFINFGVSAEFPAHRRRLFFIYPEVSLRYYFINQIKGITWNTLLLRAGVSVRFREPIPPPPPPPPPIEPPLLPLPQPLLPPSISARISYKYFDSTGVEKKNLQLQIEDFVSLNMKPLLNYIFFDHNSFEIPKRYIKLTPSETKTFSLEKLASLDVLQTYYHILNIIGKKLKESPETKVKLIGTNSGKGEEKNNLDLSYKRAVAVKDYFVNVWGIEPSRIEVEARNLPKEPSNPDDPQGDEENRRVEIITDDLRILEPVLSVDTLRKIEKGKIVFFPSQQTSVGIKKWAINIKQNGELVKSIIGAGNPTKQIEWELDDKAFEKVVFGGKLDIEYNVVDSLEQVGKATAEPLFVNKITVDKKRMEGVTDREFEYYSLILFDFGSSKLERQHKNVLDFITRRVTPYSQVTIEGFTDNIGDEKVNKRISEKRAREVARWLGLINANTVGVGESYLLYDNSLPEGRFYCRTVKITIETPVITNQK